MGGLVGGIYATGRSPAEVRELINGIDWDQVLSGVTPFRDLSFRRKQDAHDFPGQLEFGLRGGLQFPSGFNTGQEVNLVLDSVALPYSEIPSFQRSSDSVCLCGHRSCLRQAACLPRRLPFTGHEIDHVVTGNLHACPIWKTPLRGWFPARQSPGRRWQRDGIRSNTCNPSGNCPDGSKDEPVKFRCIGSIHLRHVRCERTSFDGAGGHPRDGSAAEIYLSGLQQSGCHHQGRIRRGRLQSRSIVGFFCKRGRVGGVSCKPKCAAKGRHQYHSLSRSLATLLRRWQRRWRNRCPRLWGSPSNRKPSTRT